MIVLYYCLLAFTFWMLFLLSILCVVEFVGYVRDELRIRKH